MKSKSYLFPIIGGILGIIGIIFIPIPEGPVHFSMFDLFTMYGVGPFGLSAHGYLVLAIEVLLGFSVGFLTFWGLQKIFKKKR